MLERLTNGADDLKNLRAVEQFHRPLFEYLHGAPSVTTVRPMIQQFLRERGKIEEE